MISLIIPVYNHAEELKHCLVSIAAQTYKDFEVIVVDDGSEPTLTQTLSPRGRGQGEGVLFLCQEHKGGSESAQRARNLGFKHSKGEYIMFCDADVVMRPDMLEKMVKVLEGHNAAYVYSGFRLGRKTMPSFPFSAERLRRMPYIHTTSLMRREVFPGWDEAIKKFQDWDVYLTMLKKGNPGIWIPEILYAIIPRHKGGISLWLPGFMYKIAWKKLGIHIGAIERYHEGMAVIKKKHKLP